MSNITINIGDGKPQPQRRARVAVPQDPNRRPIKVVKPGQPQVAPVATRPQVVAAAQVQRQPQVVPVRPTAVTPQVIRPQAKRPSTGKKIMNVAKYATPFGVARGGLKVAGKDGKKLGKKLKKFKKRW